MLAFKVNKLNCLCFWDKEEKRSRLQNNLHSLVKITLMCETQL